MAPRDSIDRRGHAPASRRGDLRHRTRRAGESDDRPRPSGWKMSPQAVVTYLMGGRLKGGEQITPKYVGNRPAVTG